MPRGWTPWVVLTISVFAVLIAQVATGHYRLEDLARALLAGLLSWVSAMGGYEAAKNIAAMFARRTEGDTGADR
jgi:hypothetical protein